MKKLGCSMEIHEVKLPDGVLGCDEFLELADLEVGDRILTLNGCIREIRYPFECVGQALIVCKRKNPE